MTQATYRPSERDLIVAEQDRGELALIAETLSVLDQWVRALPSQTRYVELAKQLRLAEIEVRRLIDDETV
ncbi:MAG: hypothetical protein AAGJ84_15885 [Pseudomonadota bacterium]